MSRSKWAWTEGCEPGVAAYDAGELLGHGDRARLRRRSVIAAACSAKRLIRLAVASALVICVAPAPALAGSVSGAHATSPTTPSKGQSAHPYRVGVAVMALGTGHSSRDGSARVRALQRRLMSMAIGFSPRVATKLPTGGHRFSPLVAIKSPHWWPSNLPTGGAVGSVQGPHPLAGGRLGEPVAVLPVGDEYVGVMEQPVDGRGRDRFGHQLVEPGWVDVR